VYECNCSPQGLIARLLKVFVVLKRIVGELALCALLLWLLAYNFPECSRFRVCNVSEKAEAKSIRVMPVHFPTVDAVGIHVSVHVFSW
jgi:hypothetical protein